MSDEAGRQLFLDLDDPAPRALAIPGGEVVLVSVRGPGKAVNEDAAAVVPFGAGGLIAVADGMGGHAAGARASRTALETLLGRIAEAGQRGEPLRHATLDGIEAANRGVLEMGVGAGTTLAAAIVRDHRARAVHVGDSMVLHVGQRGRIKALTIPHSPTGYAVEAGLMEEGAALLHEERHVITNFVGSEAMRIELGASIPLARRDTLLVASDGLCDNLTLDEIVGFVRRGPLDAAATGMTELARERMRTERAAVPGKPDDLTFLLYRRGA